MYIQIIVNLIFCKITINYVNNLFKKYSRQIHCMHVNLQNAILSIFFMSRLFQFLSVRIFFFGHSTAENDTAFNIKFLSSSTSPSNYALNRQFHIFFLHNADVSLIVWPTNISTKHTIFDPISDFRI